MATTNSITGPVKGEAEIAPADENAQRQAHDWRVPAWPLRIASIIYGYLWFSELGWKLPWNNFVSAGEAANGVVVNTAMSATQPGPFVDNGGGLYHWMTQEAIYGNSILPFYGDLIKNVVLPNWQLFGWLTFFLESTIALLLILGLFSRLGGFLAFVQGLNLFLGLSQHPQEWVWSYGMLTLLGFIFMLTGPGRVWGLDQWLRPTLRERMAGGNRFAGLLYKLT